MLWRPRIGKSRLKVNQIEIEVMIAGESKSVMSERDIIKFFEENIIDSQNFGSSSSHLQRFFRIGRMLFRYLIVKLQILVERLLCVADHIELGFGKECSNRKEMIAPWDGKLCNKTLFSFLTAFKTSSVL